MESPIPTPTEASPRLAELRVMTVEELIAAAISPTPEEVVVRGWLTRSSVTFDCNVELDSQPLIAHCQDFGLSLSDVRVPADPGAIESSTPHVVPVLGVDAHAAVAVLPGTVVEVLAVGHLMDLRWPTCPVDEQEECLLKFVIDRIAPDDRPIVDDIPEPW